MRSLLIVVFILSVLDCLKAQSISETRIWLKSTVQNYLDHSMYSKQIWMDFNDKEIWFSSLSSEGVIVNQLTAKDLNQVIVKQTNRGYTLFLGCKLDKRCCEVVRYGVSSTGTAERIYGEKKDYPAYEVYLTRGLMDNDLPNRLKKAFIHFIDLSGGKVISDTF